MPSATVHQIKKLNAFRIICLNNRFCQIMKYHDDFIDYDEDGKAYKINGYGKKVIIEHPTFNDLADTVEKVAQVVCDNFSKFKDLFKC